VTLTAAPATGSTFAGWGGACASAGTSVTCRLTVSKNETVSATFVRVDVNVHVGWAPGLLPNGDRLLTATLTARQGCGQIDHIIFGVPGVAFNNARLAIAAPAGGPVGQERGFSYAPPPGTVIVSISIQRIAQNGGATVSPIRFVDGCEEWQTLVGSGAGAFR
jgi:hypothetical protein